MGTKFRYRCTDHPAEKPKCDLHSVGDDKDSAPTALYVWTAAALMAGIVYVVRRR